MSKDLKLEDLTKIFGSLVAVDRVHLEIRAGEFVCLLGPSGCGKTTILRMITGFEIPTEGKVIYDGRVINDLMPQQRDFGIIFQSYALFPNMNVQENISFGLKMRKVPKKPMRKRVKEMLDLVGLYDWRENYPAQLSGGQQQRVALARALAPNPSVLLLDEPLSALDAKIRVRLRAVIKRLQQELGITMIYVTHDQEEALAIADRVVVMEQGKIKQEGNPIEIYKFPRSSFVADFVGTSNFFKGERFGDKIKVGNMELLVPVSKDMPDREIYLAIRPEKVEVMKPGEAPEIVERSNLTHGRIEVITFLGAVVRLVISMDGEEIICDMVEKDFGLKNLNRGDPVDLYFPPEAFLAYPSPSTEE
ncbi:MAG: ABC transporter ATP-binding protein [Thermodesulfobacteriota bacterium]